jgi:hypothetical protein
LELGGVGVVQRQEMWLFGCRWHVKNICAGQRGIDGGGFACLRVLRPSYGYSWKGSQIEECRG